MSSTDIADNKWEMQASKPPIANIAGLGYLLMIGGVVALFGYITAMSVVAIMSPKREGGTLENQFKNDAPAAAPAEPAK